MRKLFFGSSLKAQGTNSEIASEFGIHPCQVNRWKKQAIDGLPGVLGVLTAMQAGWKATRNTWKTIFPCIVLICCFLHRKYLILSEAKGNRCRLERDLELYTVYGVLAERHFVISTDLDFTVVIPHEFRSDLEALGNVYGNAEAPKGRFGCLFVLSTCTCCTLIYIDVALQLAVHDVRRPQTEIIRLYHQVPATSGKA